MKSEDNKDFIDVDVVHEGESEVKVEINIKSNKLNWICKVWSAIKAAFKSVINAIRKK